MSSPKPDLRELAERFARKATSDEVTIEKLAGDAEVPDEVIGFHAQQAVEKLLKAALASAGVVPPRIHDIGELGALLADAGITPPNALDAARAFVPWAVEFRYEEVLDERIDRTAARDTVAQVRAWVDRLLGTSDDAGEKPADVKKPAGETISNGAR